MESGPGTGRPADPIEDPFAVEKDESLEGFKTRLESAKDQFLTIHERRQQEYKSSTRFAGLKHKLKSVPGIGKAFREPEPSEEYSMAEQAYYAALREYGEKVETDKVEAGTVSPETALKEGKLAAIKAYQEMFAGRAEVDKSILGNKLLRGAIEKYRNLPDKTKEWLRYGTMFAAAFAGGSLALASGAGAGIAALTVGKRFATRIASSTIGAGVGKTLSSWIGKSKSYEKYAQSYAEGAASKEGFDLSDFENARAELEKVAKMMTAELGNQKRAQIAAMIGASMVTGFGTTALADHVLSSGVLTTTDVGGSPQRPYSLHGPLSQNVDDLSVPSGGGGTGQNLSPEDIARNRAVYGSDQPLYSPQQGPGLPDYFSTDSRLSFTDNPEIPRSNLEVSSSSELKFTITPENNWMTKAVASELSKPVAEGGYGMNPQAAVALATKINEWGEHVKGDKEMLDLVHVGDTGTITINSGGLDLSKLSPEEIRNLDLGGDSPLVQLVKGAWDKDNFIETSGYDSATNFSRPRGAVHSAYSHGSGNHRMTGTVIPRPSSAPEPTPSPNPEIPQDTGTTPGSETKVPEPTAVPIAPIQPVVPESELKVPDHLHDPYSNTKPPLSAEEAARAEALRRAQESTLHRPRPTRGVGYRNDPDYYFRDKGRYPNPPAPHGDGTGYYDGSSRSDPDYYTRDKGSYPNHGEYDPRERRIPGRYYESQSYAPGYDSWGNRDTYFRDMRRAGVANNVLVEEFHYPHEYRHYGAPINRINIRLNVGHISVSEADRYTRELYETHQQLSISYRRGLISRDVFERFSIAYEGTIERIGRARRSY